MKRVSKSAARRLLALAMTLMLTPGLLSPAAAAQSITPTCDETYYATLDYYGGILDSSVVKSYHTYGNSTLTDYGVYDQVINLTDSRSAAVTDSAVTFDLTGDIPDKFYFEAKTAQPYEEFPWALSLSYTLNGVPTPAEELAGATGVVEITLNAVPNPNASEYARNNLVLTATSMFNGDDILSLEAPGAQVQLVGNLYCVLYAVLPGEEQHFTMRVGSEAFSYSGMVFLAVPATLEQLDQIADLREAKEKVEDSYDAINDSMDVILNTLDGMSGSLSATANGLDRLNQARETISNGKDQVYGSLDTALDAAGPLTESLEPMAGHLATAQQALTETTALLNEMSSNITALKPEVENTRKLLKNMQDDLDNLQELLDDLEDYPDDARRIAKALSSDLSNLGSSLRSLEQSLNSLRGELSGMDNQLAGVSGGSEVKINGKTVDEIRGLVSQANSLRAAYEASEFYEVLTFQEFITAYLQNQGMDETTAASNAASLAGLWLQAQDSDFEDQLAQAEELNEILAEANLTVDQMKSLVGTANNKVSPILQQLEGLCSALGSANLSGDLKRLSDLMADLLKDVDDHSGTASAMAGTLKSAAELAIRVSSNADTALDQLENLTGIMNTYEPEAQQALEDAKTFADSSSTSITALVDAARAAEGLAKDSGTDLDAGTKQALSGLSSALRQSTAGLGQTGTIRNAIDTVDALINDEWDSHTGGMNNVLLMDAGAAPQSLTDSRNEGTTSIQYIMRSQEIKVTEDKADDTGSAEQADQGTFWSRVKAMFQDIWAAIIGIF